MIQPSARRFEFLDGLRGIAALLVTLLHFYHLIDERSTASFPLFIDYLFKNGNFGVQIFFVLSGFVIAYSIRHEWISFSFIMRFFIRRSIRLDPPYWIALTLLTGLMLLGPFLFNQGIHYVPSFTVFIFNALYLSNIMEVATILPVAWTLCLEFQFYILFVLLVKMVQGLNNWQGLATFNYSSVWGILILVPLLLFSLLEAVEWNFWPTMQGSFLPYWYSFFFGCLTCWTLIKCLDEHYYWLALAITALFSLINRNADMAATLVTSWLIFTLAKRGKLHDTLNSPNFQYVGKISYSLYLIHWPVGVKFISLLTFILGEDFHAIPNLVIMLTGLLITFIAAHYFYEYVEYPSLKLSQKLSWPSTIKTDGKINPIFP